MNESKPSEHITEAMPPFPRRSIGNDKRFGGYAPVHWPFPGEVGFPQPEKKAFMFDNIKPGDMVRIDSWLPVTNVDGDNITIAGAITTGRESIVGHKPKERTPDEIWAGLTAEQKRALIHGVT